MNIKTSFASLALAGAVAALPMSSQAAVVISVRIAPPVLPVYEQPYCPGDGYIWTPGYWSWDPNVADYYWVPGTWVLAPQHGYLWTPGYWGFVNGAYLWNAGYWGPHIGFYGGVNYGFGYSGVGYEGGYWHGDHFFYNTAINRVNVNVIHNTYIHNVTVVNNTHVAFNGGPGGVNARPSPGEQAAFHENHVAPTGIQMQHAEFARQDRSQFASANHGQPPAAAMARPAQSVNAFHGGNVVSGTRPSGAMTASRPTNNGAGMPQRNGFANTEARPGAQGAQPASRPAFNGADNRPQVQSTPAPRPQAQPQSRPAPESRPAPASHPAPAAHGGGEHEHR